MLKRNWRCPMWTVCPRADKLLKCCFLICVWAKKWAKKFSRNEEIYVDCLGFRFHILGISCVWPRWPADGLTISIQKYIYHEVTRRHNRREILSRWDVLLEELGKDNFSAIQIECLCACFGLISEEFSTRKVSCSNHWPYFSSCHVSAPSPYFSATMMLYR